ncbi:hypothetical protein RT717_17255 [Imperialibacter roseus]|uniref:ATP-binding protein n=1 Tax=Imperialibacter roseus TaxID=1324217 RepID=A0ABZ0IIG9_9BACT|nr:hypothetical protein [Imperialibacter roseus]WOK04833.1 hypothetical protein RT717_17255 [Imperialibacter roseus]
MQKEITQGNLGAINALKGYRTQALYSIHRVMEDGNPDLIYVPEGIEDLDVFDQNGILLECIQIKATTGTLSFSNLISGKKGSFFHRAVETFEKGHRPKLQVKCFGKLSESLLNSFSEETSIDVFIEKFEKYGFKKEQITYLKENTFFEALSESDYQQRTIDLIKNKAVAVDSIHALEYLHYWLFFLSEKGGSVTERSLLSKLNDIGRFINERENFHRHLHSSIRVIKENASDDEQAEKLSESFYQGTGVKYSHIKANLDVKRDEKLNRISESFFNNDSVIIHGASGQGKSALAYRFIGDYYPMLTYEVIILDRLDSTLEQIQALRAISKSLEIPIIIYIDVPPGNQNWMQILKDFAFSRPFKFLVTIREEDWNRTPEKGTEFTFEDIYLEFAEEEAKLIYERLNERLLDKKFTDFDEAWLVYGGKGPLLEFTYLVTQGKTLRSKIESQLNRIENENHEFIQLLKIVSFSDSYGARVRVKALQETNGFDKLRLAVSFLEREYLLQFSENELWLIGLHPIRSEIISQLLHLSNHDLESTCLKSLDLIEGADLFVFLTGAFRSDFIKRETVIDKLNCCSWDDYVSCQKVCNSLVWLGTKAFIESHHKLIDEIYREDTALLTLKAHLDFTGTVSLIKFFEDNDNWKERVQRNVRLFEEYEISKEDIFKYARNWLEVVEINIESIRYDIELSAFGEFLFWLGYLLPEKRIHLNENDIVSAIGRFSIQSASRAMFGMHTYDKDAKKVAIDCEEQFLERLQSQYKIALIERDSYSIKAHFILDIFEDYDEEGNIPHLRKLEIIDALRYSLPYLRKHGAKAYGHKIYLLSLEHDDSEAEIPVENNPVEYLVDLNSVLQNLFVFKKRPFDWSDFVKQMLEIRKDAISLLGGFLDVLEEYHRKKRAQVILGEYALKVITDDQLAIQFALLFPQSISDESGLVAEGERESEFKQNILVDNTISILNRKFKGYRDRHNDIFRSLDSFHWQSIKCIVDKLNLSLDKHRGLMRTSLVNIFDAYERLSEYQTSFGQHFEKYLDSDDLKELQDREEQILRSLAFGWKHIINPTQIPFKKSLRKESFDYLNKLKGDFERRVKRDCSRETEGSNYIIQLEPHFIEETKTVIIVADAVDALDNLNGLALALKVFNNVIGGCKYLSLKHLMLDLNYNSFWVVTSVFNQVAHSQAYKFKLHQFTLGGIENLQPSSFIPDEVDRRLTEQLGLEVKSDHKGQVALADSMMKYYHELTITMGVTSQLSVLADFDGYSQIGEVILKEQIQKSIDKAGKSFYELAGNLSEQLKYFERRNDIDELDQEYFSFLSDIGKAISPVPNDEGEENIEVTLNLEQVEQWKDRLEKVGEKITLVYLFLLQQAFEEE